MGSLSPWSKVEGPVADTSPDLVCPVCGGRGSEAFCPRDGQRRIPPAAIDSDDPLIGKLLAGRYAIERRLGQGGMGAVYLATQALVERKVVVKVMRSDTDADEVVRGRFLREARAASRVTHPNVITIYDFGYTDEGMAYLVMELVDGPSLADIMEADERLPWRRAASVVAQAARALEAAHRAGIVHRDIKPGNVMLTTNDDGTELVKVLDFGVARVQDSGDARLTRTGAVMGTPAYMAPEQVAGREVGPQADIYALAAMLFDLVTGQLPFDGKNVTDVLLKHLSAQPPTMRSVATDIDVPEALEALVARCMAKAPGDRPQSAGAVAAELERIASGQGAQPPAATPTVNALALEVTGEAPSSPSGGVDVVAPAAIPVETAVPTVDPVAVASVTKDAPTKRATRRWWALGLWFVVAAAAVVALLLRPGDEVEERDALAGTAEEVTERSDDARADEPRAPALPPIPRPRGLRLDGLPIEETP